MSSAALHAISPVDGRYQSQTQILSPYFSEASLIKYRIRVEVEYLIALAELPLPGVDWNNLLSNKNSLLEWASALNDTHFLRVKEIEKTTNHDVKAVEYLIKEFLDQLNLGQYREWVHFGLTSQDINNTAVPLSLKEAHESVFFPGLMVICKKLEALADEWQNVPMLAHTHGQPASPTLLGKEIQVFVSRLNGQVKLLQQVPFTAKFGGATGNFNAHHVCFPKIDWHRFGKDFVENKLGLNRTYPTTQIEPYDNLAAYFDNLKRINTILMDVCKDFWAYISMDYFRQTIKKGEVGSSAMPHKVNPIDFENAEGNLGIANALFEHFSAKLPISRLQRDLTDSTVLRNVGVPISHSLISFNSILKGLNKLLLNQEKLNQHLDQNWAVAAEAIQTILRRENYPNPYETLKELTRTGEKITKESLHQFIQSLQVSDHIKEELLNITPFNYTGQFSKD